MTLDLLKIVNTEEGKQVLGILGQKPKNKIVHITHNSFIEHLGGKKYQATFFSRRPIEKLFQPILDKIQIANDEYKRITNKREAFLHYSGLETKNYKYPQIFLITSPATFNPASGANSPVDGTVSREGVDEAFATIRAGAGTIADTGSGENYLFRVRNSTTSSQYSEFLRSFQLFDTSTLTAGAIISSAVFSVFFTTGDNTVASGGANVVSSTPANTNNLVTGDYNNVGSTRFSTDKTYAGITGSAYNDFTYNASGIAAIDKGGISKFAIRSVCDIDNAAPTWVGAGAQGYYLSYFADHGSNLPKLVVTFTLPSGSYRGYSFLM